MAPKSNFRRFVFCENRRLLIYSIGALGLFLILIKLLYPHAIIAPDSNQLIRTASNNVELTAWPIGYPKFIEWLHAITPNDWAIVLFQYVLMEGAVVYLFFTVKFIFYLRGWISWLTLFLLLVNPFILCMSNYILTDSPFSALTVIWFTLSIWHLYRPGPIYSVLLILTLVLAFTIRYNAIFYPIITVPLIVLSKTRIWIKTTCIALGILLFVAFIQYTESLFNQLTGKRVFSPFSGWQLAGNALIMYRHVPNREQDTAPSELESLQQYMIHALNTFPPPDVVNDRDLFVFFPWKAGSPLVVYSRAFYSIDPTSRDLQRWAIMGNLYRDYGMFLIKRHPIAYIRYYVEQGLDWYVNPKKELVNEFPDGGYWTTNRTRQWFGYKSNWVPCSTSKILSLAYFPPVLTFLNISFIICTFVYFYCEQSPVLVKKGVIFLGMVYWMSNFLFTITTAPFVLRYGLSIMIIELAIIPVLLYEMFLPLPKSRTAALSSS